MREHIEIGYQAFVSDGGEEFGAIRGVAGDALVVYVENAGEFRIPREPCARLRGAGSVASACSFRAEPAIAAH